MTNFSFVKSAAISLVVLASHTFTTAAISKTLVNGAGATFPQPLYALWFSEFSKTDKEASINYQAIGSGGGIRQFVAGTVDFGATDEPMSVEEEAKLTGKVAHIPTVLGAVVVSYNIPGIKDQLNLDGALVSEIFMGTVKKWNDPKIVAQNPNLKLPDLAINPAYRSDGSGTTGVFTDYLNKVSPEFKTKVGQGKAVQWPVGVGGKGNSGVAGIISQNPGSIGYVELIFAEQNKLTYAKIKNASGAYISPSLKATSAAASGKSKEMIAQNFKVSVTNSLDKDAYPISSFTWILVHDPVAPGKGEKIVQFLKWALSPAGQKLATDLGYAPLPADIAKSALEKIAKLSPKAS